MIVSTQLLDHNALAICTYNPTNSVTITCSIQPTGVVTMAIKVLHNTCNMCIRDLPDINALIPWACGPQPVSGIHMRQIPHTHVATMT